MSLPIKEEIFKHPLFDTEKLLLDPGDSIIGITTNGTISATASYTDVV